MIWLFFNESDNRKDANVRYFCHHNPSFCILAYDSKSKKKCLFVTPFEKGQYKGIQNIEFKINTFKEDLKNYFKVKRISKVGINKKSLSLSLFERIKEILFFTEDKFVDVSENLLNMRILKNDLELVKIKKASKLADKVFSEIINKIKKRELLTEIDIKNYILKRGIEEQVELSFDPVVASGNNSALPHHIPTNSHLTGFVVIDMGYKYKGYCSDMTRTIFVESKDNRITKQQLDTWNLIKEMHDYAVESICKYIKHIKIEKKNNIVSKKFFFNKIDMIIRSNLGDDFCHSLGHGVGLDIHEAPALSSNSKDCLNEGMVFTIEPGIYLKKGKERYGVRHENLFTYVNGKLIKITKSDEELIMLKNF